MYVCVCMIKVSSHFILASQCIYILKAVCINQFNAHLISEMD